VAGYVDDEVVAERLWHVLGRRPRLAFDAGALDAVAAALGRARPSVAAVGPAVLAATAAALTP
jgi:hypothetical protein